MESPGVQQHFFNHIKGILPGHISMVDDVAELLDISIDSAYRRIRGEKPISLEEMGKLCSHYKISLDQFLHLPSDSFLFSGKIKTDSPASFEDYLENVLTNFTFFNSFKHKHLSVLMKDIQPFVHFQIPELAKFKFYFWMKSILHYEDMKTVKFSFHDPRYDPFKDTGKKIIDLYNRIPMTEIWNAESINSTLRQINFYYESGSFENKADAGILYSKVEELINHLERQAELGVKFNIGEEPGSHAASYRLFVNELILGDNTYLAELDGSRLTFLNHSVLYFVATKDERFNTAMFENLQNLVKKSTQISTIGEKERVRFFNRLREEIHHKQAALS
ncbi:MAG: helix-turn-helix domain-containing protein [Ferruginibacter sp.]